MATKRKKVGPSEAMAEELELVYEEEEVEEEEVALQVMMNSMVGFYVDGILYPQVAATIIGITKMQQKVTSNLILVTGEKMI